MPIRSPQRLQPTRVAGGQVERVELGGAAGTEHVDPGRQHPVLAHHRVDLGLEPGTQPHQLVAVADQLAQLADLRRGDPRLGQTTQAQQVDQIVGVTLVVLHPPVAPVVAQRVRQMHVRAHLVRASRPPSTTRTWPPATTSGSGPAAATASANATGSLSMCTFDNNSPVGVLAHDHRPAAVQIDTDIFSFHGNLLSS